MTATPGRPRYDRQIACLQARDLHALSAQYAEDASRLGFDVRVERREAKQAYLGSYIDRLGRLHDLSLDKWAEMEDSPLFEAAIRADLVVARVYDAFAFREGQATHHSPGSYPSTPPGNSAGAAL